MRPAHIIAFSAAIYEVSTRLHAVSCTFIISHRRPKWHCGKKVMKNKNKNVHVFLTPFEFFFAFPKQKGNALEGLRTVRTKVTGQTFVILVMGTVSHNTITIVFCLCNMHTLPEQ